MRFLYSIILYLTMPFILLRLYFKGRKLPAYRLRIKERFALANNNFHNIDVWLHAVSLGEVIAATPVIDALLKNHRSVLVTTMTPTGSQQVIKRFGVRVAHQYLPYDLPWCLRRFLNNINARVGVIMETELWPNMFREACRCGLSLMLVNARLSDNSYKQYKKIRFLFKKTLNALDAVFAQSAHDAQRFIDLGVASNKVRILGNMKFDLQTTLPTEKISQQLKVAWGQTRPILIIASTHANEEPQILSQIRALQTAIPNIIILVAPRHPERFQETFDWCVLQEYKTALRSQPATINTDTEIVILNSLGELLMFYSISDYAFVGGSLVPVGGHNVLEPIAMHIPVFCGPYMNNFKTICEDLCAAQAIKQVQNVAEFIMAIKAMHQAPKLRAQQIANATAVLEANKGTVARYVAEIELRLN